MAEKSLLIGDRVAALLVQYAVLIAKSGSADAVQLHALGIDGEQVVATLLLNGGTVLIAESTESSLPEPDNRALIDYLQSNLEGFSVAGMQSWDDLKLPDDMPDDPFD
jgi:hypothetical protein